MAQMLGPVSDPRPAVATRLGYGVRLMEIYSQDIAAAALTSVVTQASDRLASPASNFRTAGCLAARRSGMGGVTW
jgi:hypothetical protein